MAAPSSSAVSLLAEGTPLYKRELFQHSASVSSRRNLVLQPPGKKGTARIVAADDAGQIVSLQLVGKVPIPSVSWIRYAAGDIASASAAESAKPGSAASTSTDKKPSVMSSLLASAGLGSAAPPSPSPATAPPLPGASGGAGAVASTTSPYKIECLSVGIPDESGKPTLAFASGTTIFQLDKWGKAMLGGGTFNTNSTEPVRHLAIGPVPAAVPNALAMAQATGISGAAEAVAANAAAAQAHQLTSPKGIAGSSLPPVPGSSGGARPSLFARAMEATGLAGVAAKANPGTGASAFDAPVGASVWAAGDHVASLFETVGSGPGVTSSAVKKAASFSTPAGAVLISPPTNSVAKDVAYGICPDKILCVVSDRFVSDAPHGYDALVGCADGMVRLFAGPSGATSTAPAAAAVAATLASEAAVEGPVTSLAVLEVQAPSSAPTGSAAPLSPSASATNTVNGSTYTTNSGAIAFMGGSSPSDFAACATPSAIAAMSSNPLQWASDASVRLGLRFVFYGCSNGAVGCLKLQNGQLSRFWSFACAPSAAGSEVLPSSNSGAMTSAAADAAASESSSSAGGIEGGGRGTVASLDVGANAGSTGGSNASVASLTLGDVDADGLPELIVARDDGCIEVYSLKFDAHRHLLAFSSASSSASSSSSFLPAIPGAESDGEGHKLPAFAPYFPRLSQVVSCGESVRCIAAGLISPDGVPPTASEKAQLLKNAAAAPANQPQPPIYAHPRHDVVVQTYQGRLFVLSSEGGQHREPGDALSRSREAVQRELHVNALNKELEELKKRITKEKERINKGSPGSAGASSSSLASATATSAGVGAGAAGQAMTATGAPADADGNLPVQRLEAITSLALDPADGAYTLTMEVPAAIDIVILQSTLALDLMLADGSSFVGGNAGATGGGAAGGDAASSVGGTAAALAAAAATALHRSGLSGSSYYTSPSASSSSVPSASSSSSSSSFSTAGVSSALGASVASLFDSLEAQAKAIASGSEAGQGIEARLGPPLMALQDSGVSAAVLLSGGAASSAKPTPATVSQTPCDAASRVILASPASGSGSSGTSNIATLATYRLQEPTSRVVIRFRVIEGQSGEVQALLMCTSKPPTSAAAVRAAVRPLSLHHRLPLETPQSCEAALTACWADYCARFQARSAAAGAVLSELQPAISAAAAHHVPGAADIALPPSPPASYPLGTLTLTGSFSLSQMHEWVGQCLPDVPTRIPASAATSASTTASEESVSLAYKSVVVGTVLLASYKKGSAVFRSDNPSSLAILRDHISNAATALKVRLQVAADVPSYALRHVMALLHAKLSYLLTLQAKADVIEAVREMVNTETASANAGGMAVPDLSFLHPAYIDVLAHADTYARQAGRSSSSGAGTAAAAVQESSGMKLLTSIAGIAADACVDYHRFANGKDVVPKVPEAMAMLTGQRPHGGGDMGESPYLTRPLEVLKSLYEL